jgi:transcriptional regulator with XRE-family HTH domain
VADHETPNALLRAAREDLGWSQAEVAAARGIHPAAHAKIERASDIRWSTLVDSVLAMGGRVHLAYTHPDRHSQTITISSWQSLDWLVEERDGQDARIRAFARAIRDALDLPHVLRSIALMVTYRAGFLTEDQYVAGFNDYFEGGEQGGLEGEDGNSHIVPIRAQEHAMQVAYRRRVYEVAAALRTPGLYSAAAFAVTEVAAGRGLLRKVEDPAPNGPLLQWIEPLRDLPEDARDLIDGDEEQMTDLAVYLREGAPGLDDLIALAERFRDDEEFAQQVFSAAGYPPIPTVDFYRPSTSAKEIS